MSDERLVRRILRKDPRAFDEFFESYFGRLYRFCAVRVRDDDACEEIVQEAMIKALANLQGFRGGSTLFSWLCQICRREVADWRRRAGRSITTVSLDDESLPGGNAEGASGFDELDRARTTQELVHRTLDELPDRYACVLEWKYVGGFAVAEIAYRLGIEATAAQSLLARARSAFRKRCRGLQQGLDGRS